MVYEVERVVAGKCKVALSPNPGGRVHEPEELLETVEELIK